jgi:L-serine/L-threonine ammonia-lyase
MYRGVSDFIQKAKQKHGSNLRIIAASSDNAALAAACASKALFLKCTVFVTRDTSQNVIEFLKREDAEVVIGGSSYSETLEKAKAAVAANPNAYVSTSGVGMKI